MTGINMQVTHSSADNLKRCEEFRDWLLEQELTLRAAGVTPQVLAGLRLEVERIIKWMRSHPVIN